MARKTAKPRLTPEEARTIIRRRIAAWKETNALREELARKEKAQRKDIEGCLVAMRADEFESAGVKAQLVRSSPVRTKDTGNVEFLRKSLTPAEFEEFCPRVIQASKVGEVKPDLVEGLSKGSTRKLRMDYIQETAPQAS